MISITNAAKEPHITPLQDSMWHRGIAGIDSCVFNFFENFAAEVSSNNSVKIRSGIGMIQGRYFCVEPSTYDEVTIANGTQGEKRKDLIVCRWTVDEEQKVQSGDWVVIQGTPTTGTPAAPSHTAGDLDAGDLIADMPFYEVTLDGINVTGVAQKFTSLGGIKKVMNIPSNALKFLTGNGNGDTPTNWGKAGAGMAYIRTEGMLTNQPMKYGWLLNYTAGGSVVAQQFVGLDGNSPVWYRSGNSSGWYPGSNGWIRSQDDNWGAGGLCVLQLTSNTGTWGTSGGTVTPVKIAYQSGGILKDNGDSTFTTKKACKVKVSGSMIILPADSNAWCTLRCELRKGGTQLAIASSANYVGNTDIVPFSEDIVNLSAGDTIRLHAYATAANKLRLGAPTTVSLQIL